MARKAWQKDPAYSGAMYKAIKKNVDTRLEHFINIAAASSEWTVREVHMETLSLIWRQTPFCFGVAQVATILLLFNLPHVEH